MNANVPRLSWCWFVALCISGILGDADAPAAPAAEKGAASGEKASAAVKPSASAKRAGKAAERAWPTPEQLVRDRGDGVERIPLLAPGPGNPRNSEGSFVNLADGRILFVYSHFTGGGGDHSAAFLAGRFSSDGGRTWTRKDVVVVPKEGDWNVMSVSLLRLQDGRIALFYIRKNSLSDCRPMMRISSDEAQTFGPPTVCIQDQVGYYVLNNDRAVQLRGGRLVLPGALHNLPSYAKPDWAGIVMCYLSDDLGRTWRRSKSQLTGKLPASGKRVTVQEPGVVELKDGRLMMFCRTTAGSQYLSFSSDGGDTGRPWRRRTSWRPVRQPRSNVSPRPATCSWCGTITRRSTPNSRASVRR